MNGLTPALEVDQVIHRYGDKRALDGLTLSVEPNEIFSILGPNGSGKTTLFRLTSTLVRVQEGSVKVFGLSTRENTAGVRQQLGIVFQSPSLDGKLSVLENIRCQAALYGLNGSAMQSRVESVMQTLGISDRRGDRCDELSGGLKRRVELAKGMLHRPRLLLLDEPSTGLDPAARLDLWHALTRLRDEFATTIVLTTHLLEEADKCDRLAILDHGKCVAIGRPDELRREMGGDVLAITSDDPKAVSQQLSERFQLESQIVQQQVRITADHAAQLVAPISESLGKLVQSLTLGRPSLEDVFIARTGHEFWRAPVETATKKKRR